MNVLSKLVSPLLALLLLLCMTLACSRLSKPRDNGGIYLLLAVKADAGQPDQSIERTIAIVQNRCERLGVYCVLQRQSGERDKQILMRVSSSMETARIKNILLGEGMEMRAVVSPSSPVPLQTYATQAEAAATAGKDKDVLPYEMSYDKPDTSQRFIIVERKPVVTGQDIRRAGADSQSNSGAGRQLYSIHFMLNPEGAARLKDWTSKSINNYIAVIFNKKAVSVAYIRSEISDSGEITGNFTKQEAEDTAQVLMSGNLPAPIEVLEEGTYKP